MPGAGRFAWLDPAGALEEENWPATALAAVFLPSPPPCVRKALLIFLYKSYYFAAQIPLFLL
jgi:hypothetical protein